MQSPQSSDARTLDALCERLAACAEEELSGGWLFKPVIWDDGTYKLIFEHRLPDRPDHIDEREALDNHFTLGHLTEDDLEKLRWVERISYRWNTGEAKYTLISEEHVGRGSKQLGIYDEKTLFECEPPAEELEPFNLQQLVDD